MIGGPESRVVVVTGASAGVGRAVVQQFAREGARLGLIARGRERLEAAQREVEQSGGQAILLPADVANAEEIESAADQVEREFGPIDVWVNNAMTTVFAPFHQITAAEFKRATEVTYLGCVHGTMAAIKRMRTRDRGTIVQVGSALAYRSIPLQSAYCGAKHAIVGFTDSIRSELIHQWSGIHITMVHLPAMNTPQFSWCRTRLPRQPQPVPPIFQPEVAARAIVWASSHKRRELYVAWPTVKAIWGQKSRLAMRTSISRNSHIAVRKRNSPWRETVRIISSSRCPPITLRTAFSIAGRALSVRWHGWICIAG